MAQPRSSVSGRTRSLRIARLVATKNAFLDEIEGLARDGSWQEGSLWGWRTLEGLRRRMAEASSRAVEACDRRGITPAALPGPSRRAFQLITYLSSDGRLETHLSTLREMQRAADGVEARLDHTGYLYRFERDGDRIRLGASEGFLGAPPPILAGLVRLAVPYARKRAAREAVRRYAESQAYAAAIREIESSGGAYQSRPQGEVYDLSRVFEAVNERYFGGELRAPRLVWSDRATFREFGHYEPASDTIQISLTLDSQRVPPFVIEHVMHHEILHRVIGAEGDGGRRRYHSARFRRAERRFPRFREAEAFLRKLSEEGER